MKNFAGSAVMKVAKPESQAMMSQTGSLSMTRALPSQSNKTHSHQVTTILWPEPSIWVSIGNHRMWESGQLKK